MKKGIYIFFTAILGFLLSLLLHAGIESIYLYWLRGQGKTPVWSSVFGGGQCALPIWLELGLAISGIAFGVWLGFQWWRIVYIEKRHWRMKNKT